MEYTAILKHYGQTDFHVKHYSACENGGGLEFIWETLHYALDVWHFDDMVVYQAGRAMDVFIYWSDDLILSIDRLKNDDVVVSRFLVPQL